MPAQLAIRRVSVSLAGRSVLSSVSFAVGPDARIGLLGRNGVGKTTLLRVLAGAVPPDAGRVIRAPEDLHVGYLEQEPLARSGETLGELFERRTGIAAALAQADTLAANMGEALEPIQPYTDARARGCTRRARPPR